MLWVHPSARIHETWLRAIRELPRAWSLADQDTLGVACYRLLVAIEAALPICFHVIGQRLQRVPDTYADCFALLGDAEIVSEDLIQRLQRVAGFWNVRLHVSWDADYDLVYDVLHPYLGDLNAFVLVVGRLV